MDTRATSRSGALRCLQLLAPISAAAVCLSFALPPAVVVTRLADLGFGDVAMNESKQIAFSGAGAASFRIDATGFVAQTQVAVTFALPNLLTSGGSTVPVTFSNSDAAWSYTNAVASATTFNPNVGTNIPKNGANFSIYVWIGAQLDASGSPAPNLYTNSLTINAAAQ